MVIQVASADLLDPRLLQLFAALLETRSVTRAAVALGQSQPNVSLWLGKLRQHFGDPLFVRTAHGMVPTPRAESLAGPVHEALQGLRRVSDPARPFVAAESQQTFRLCMTDGSHIALLPPVLERVLEAAPQVRLEVVPIGDQTAADLESGRADLALGIVPDLETGFYQQAFFQQDFICLVGPRHPLAGGGLTLRAYREAAHVEVLSGRSHEFVAHALRAQGLTRTVRLTLPGFLGLGTVVAETELVATLPRQIGELIAGSTGLAALPCPVPVPGFTVKQYWHARMHRDQANQWLRGVCAEALGRGRKRH